MYILRSIDIKIFMGRHGHDRMIVGFTTT